MHIVEGNFPSHYQGVDIGVIGTITTIPKKKPRKTSFQFKIKGTQIEGLQFLKGRKIKLSWFDTEELPDIGDEWFLTVRLKKPRGLMNPAGFDYEKWLMHKGIVATGYVRNKGINRLIQKASTWTLSQLRTRILQKIQDLSIDETPKSLIKALVVGDGSTISSEHWQWFRKTGTSHLLVISGLHIGLVAAVSAGIVTFFWKLYGIFKQPLLDKGVVVGMISFCVAMIYAGLAGFTIPTSRALIMLGVYLVYAITRRHNTKNTAFFVALLLVLLVFPLSPLAPGFWLSFSAVLGIFILHQRQVVQQSGLGEWLVWHTYLALIMLPLTSLFFSYSSIVAPIVNFVTIPVLALLIVPLSLVSTIMLFLIPDLGQVMMTICAFLLEWVMVLVGYFAQVEWAGFWFKEISLWGYGSAGLAILLFLLPRGTGLNRLSIPLALVLFFPSIKQLESGEFELEIIDIGQGLSVFVKTANHNLLFDTGGMLTQHNSMASAIVIPYFLSQGLDQLDKLIISHPDRDHAAGLTDVLEQMSVTSVITAQKFKQELQADEVCDRTLSWEWDQVHFEFINDVSKEYSRRNDYSCVLRISNSQSSALITGDIEKSAEKVLLSKSLKNVDLLIVPHHGSKTSSTLEFVQATNPKAVIYTVGYRNWYRFPHASVSQRYRSVGAQEYRSDRDGLVRFNFSPTRNTYRVSTYRSQHKEFWRTDFDF